MGSGRPSYERAVDAFTRAIEIDPLFADAYMQRGVLYWREIQNYHRAIRDLGQVLELDSERTEALYYRALAYQARGDFDQAIMDYERFLVASSDSVLRESAQIQLEGAKVLKEAREVKRGR